MNGQLDLDLAVAKALDFPCPSGGAHKWRISLATGCDKCNQMLPLYSSDISRAFQVEDRIAELGLKHEYVIALTKAIANATGSNCYEWHLIHASPEQRCRAALEAVKEKAKAASS